MRIERDCSYLPIEEQIKKLRSKIKFLSIFAIIWNIFAAIVAVLILKYTSEKPLAIGFLFTIPLSLFFGGYLRIKEYKRQIKVLQEEQREEEQQKNNYYR